MTTPEFRENRRFSFRLIKEKDVIDCITENKQIKSTEMDNMFIENKSKFNLEETVTKLTEAVGKSEWKLIHMHDLQQLMHKNGLEVLPARVMEICAPSFAFKLLSKDEERIYSNMMPCRVSVYEKGDGETYVSRMNIEQFASQMGGVVQEVMEIAFRGAESFINQVVE